MTNRIFRKWRKKGIPVVHFFKPDPEKHEYINIEKSKHDFKGSESCMSFYIPPMMKKYKTHIFKDIAGEFIKGMKERHFYKFGKFFGQFNMCVVGSYMYIVYKMEPNGIIK